MEAKWRYAKQGNSKHIDDCMELINLQKEKCKPTVNPSF